MFTAPALLLITPFLLGAFSTLVFGRRRAPDTTPPGLLFHSVLDKPGLEMSQVSLRRFEQFCSHLSRARYRTLTVSDAPAAGNSSSTPEPCCLLTFDDGFKSVATTAMPVMERNNLKATVFCLGSHFGETSQWDIYSGNTHLSKNEIRELAAAGHEIGSHSLTHAYLPFLSSTEVQRELADSKSILEDITGKAVTSLSFPYGGWNTRIWNIARETGYTAATLYRGHSSAATGLFPVFGVYQYDTVADMMAKLTTTSRFSLVRARAHMMAHFARGTPAWKYRKEYHYP
jgi:peptidoglycan/xylan/chitin deacetylase (PgdA/CDA1 family)